MLESYPFILFLSTLLGFLSGIGVGGGSLLILWLTLVLGMPQADARSINLLFFLPSALIASCFRCRQGMLDLKTVLPGILAGCVSAALFCWLGTKLDTGILKKLFGILLLATGLREIFYKEKQSSP